MWELPQQFPSQGENKWELIHVLTPNYVTLQNQKTVIATV